ncbi:MAG TPA: diguanylate cyclase [Methylophilaceae bacterium]|nr:diguanylate cyclase [Methylophilaceae bacterium]
MSTLSQTTLEDRLQALKNRWESYVKDGRFEHFVEFTVAVNSLAEYFNRSRLPGLMRLCEGLENAAIAKLGDQGTHPITKQEMLSIQHQLDALAGSVSTSKPPAKDRRSKQVQKTADSNAWIKPRAVWIVSPPERKEMVEGLSLQLQFFGFQAFLKHWGDEHHSKDYPLAVLFIPAGKSTRQDEFAYITAIRASCPASQLLYLGEQTTMEPLVALMRAGIDVAIPSEDQPSMVLNSILNLVQTEETEKSRVLVVEDSRVAVEVIQRTLEQQGIDTFAINDPGELLEALQSYQPDLILMDMYMPHFNGVEATRVLRQMPAYNSLPIVYVSGESEVSMQVEALRLGGDQFLGKPFNPVLLAAIVKTKIERFREIQRSTSLDGLTGLLNHTAAKSHLKHLAEHTPPDGTLTVAMIDIDHFKSINDTYGHPVGDQVIRGLAWLLKGRLRSSDLIGRYGGEEFLIALPGVDIEQAKSVIDRIRKDFSTLPHAHPDGAVYATFSAGIAAYPTFNTAISLTEGADNALLQAKRMGRNRVEEAAT